MSSERRSETWQPPTAWQAKFLGFGTAWWLLLAPWLSKHLPGQSAPLVGRALDKALGLSHWALLLCALLAVCLWAGSEWAPAKDWAKYFLLGVLLMPALGVLWFVFFSGFSYC